MSEDRLSLETLGRWNRAVEHARRMLEIYKSTPGGLLGAMGIQTKIELYEAGDRSEALLEAMEAIE